MAPEPNSIKKDQSENPEYIKYMYDIYGLGKEDIIRAQIENKFSTTVPTELNKEPATK